MTDRYFSSLVQALATRSTNAFLGSVDPVSVPLRDHLRRTLGNAPGTPGSLLADPVLEAMFGWKAGEESMGDLAASGLLSDRLVKAMATRAKWDRVGEYEFPLNRYPFAHQTAAWRELTESRPKSVLVTSGTGSGKTECFLVPILDYLARLQEQERTITGVRALFLYPLNALINSQRDRLKAWCAPFNGRVRFALYNGNTPDRADRTLLASAGAEEVADRKSLRESAPPILVTNSTMLEYMLVRREDAPILAQSQGKLRYVVLDEAHTYLGSHAAETALMLRRVMHAFGVSAKDVRFIATSATIGDESERVTEQLKVFLADLSGVDPADVRIIRGQRQAPELPKSYSTIDERLPDLPALWQADATEKFEALARNAGMRRMREALLSKPAATLGLLTAARLGAEQGEATFRAASNQTAKAETLELIDLSTAGRTGESAPFLRARAHIFHRVQAGVWACVNPSCSGRQGTDLESDAWLIGRLYFERRLSCSDCGGLVLEMVCCNECGTEYLKAGIESTDGVQRYIPTKPREQDIDEEFALADDSDGEESQDAPLATHSQSTLILAVRASNEDAQPTALEVRSGELAATHGDLVTLYELKDAAGHGTRCICCGTKEDAPDSLFRPVRAGAPLFLRNILPTLLERTPAIEASGSSPSDEQKVVPDLLPFQGRRLITFTDSRQGTARYAIDAQLDSERNYVRSWVLHQLRQSALDLVPISGNVEHWRRDLADVEMALRANPTLAALIRVREDLIQKINDAGSTPRGVLSWQDLRSKLEHSPVVTKWIQQQWKHLPVPIMTGKDVAHFLLLREFARRPKRAFSLETLGFVGLEYPQLKEGARAPDCWRQRGLSGGDWIDFLTVAVDFGVRGSSAISVSQDYLNWLGAPIRPKPIVGPLSSAVGGNVTRWPSVYRGTGRNRLIRLLARVLQVTLADKEEAADVETCLQEAWEQCSRILPAGELGHQLDFERHVTLREVDSAWHCPVTRRLILTTVKGLSPYMPVDSSESLAVCTQVQMPRIPQAFWRSVDGTTATPEQRENWIASDSAVRDLQQRGAWNELSRRVLASAPYYSVSEHSAQLSASRLQSLEKRFKAGQLNVLSSSTTMEMGVDIGGLSAVAMNNAPPSPANYRQRSGRAGRRDERRAFSFTLCKATPHGDAVFRRPTWPFDTDTYVSDVSLDSERIVQRHVNALALTRFFSSLGHGELRKLTCEAFYEPIDDQPTIAERFMDWLSTDALADSWLKSGLERLVERTVLEGLSQVALLDNTRSETERVRDAWIRELNPLKDQANSLEASPETDVARRAVAFQLIRLREEYLLRELALGNFLPGHGFPTQVVALRTSTNADFKKKESTPQDKNESRGQKRGFPSRDLAIALREYAPGSSVAVDGRVVQVAGVSLNWKVPIDAAEVRDVQSLRYAYRCQTCGSFQDSASVPTVCANPACNEQIEAGRARVYLEPAGFAVDFFKDPTNDLSNESYVPMEQPWVSATSAVWQPLVRSDLGRYRVSPQGRVFSSTKGTANEGYAVCLVCGRADSDGDTGDLPESLLDHRPIVGKSAARDDGKCKGNDRGWSIKRNVWLGVSRETDVLEIQIIRGLATEKLRQERAAASIAVALRQALAEKIGVEDREIGWWVVEEYGPVAGEKVWSIKLYDTATGGAGFVTQVAPYLPELLKKAREILTCAAFCDAACQSCILSYETSFNSGQLDRHDALALLSEQFLAGLELPAELRVFGPSTRVEFETVQMAMAREMRGAGRVAVVVNGDSAGWDFDEWEMRRVISRWAGQDVSVQILLTDACIKALDVSLLNRIASVAESGQAEIVCVPQTAVRVGNAQLLCQIHRAGKTVSLATTSEDAVGIDARWGVGSTPIQVLIGQSADSGTQPQDWRTLPPTTIRRSPPGTVTARTLTSELAGDASHAGARFVDIISSGAHGGLSERLKSSIPVERVIYRDRYLTSPLTMRLIAEVFGALNGRLGASAGGAMYTVQTRAISPPKSPAREMRHIDANWNDKFDRAPVFQLLMTHFGVRSEFEVLRYSEAEHARELLVQWADGARWWARLDEGFGFLEVDSSVRYDFNASVQQQVAALRQPVRVKHRLPTHLYMSGIEQGRS